MGFFFPHKPFVYGEIHVCIQHIFNSLKENLKKYMQSLRSGLFIFVFSTASYT